MRTISNSEIHSVGNLWRWWCFRAQNHPKRLFAFAFGPPIPADESGPAIFGVSQSGTFDSWSPCRSMAPPARASARCAEQRRPPAPARPVSGTYARAGLKRRVPPRPGAAAKWCRACCCPPLQHRGARVARPCGKRRRWRVDARRRAEPGSWRSAPTPVGGARRGARWAPPARGGRPKGARAVGPRGAVQDACTPAVGGGLAHGSPW